jgi:hypothetical protein
MPQFDAVSLNELGGSLVWLLCMGILRMGD